jgi:hypothetical protein
MNRFAVLEQNFVGRPIRDRIEPAGPAVEKEQGKAQNQQEQSFADLEEGDELKVTMAPRLLQNRRDLRGLTHLPTVLRLCSLCNDRILTTADFELVAIGIFKEKRVVAGAVSLAQLRAFQSFASDLTNQSCNTINLRPALGPE